ncbi:MAG: hypothetical protein WCL02_03125 [bacterium]
MAEKKVIKAAKPAKKIEAPVAKVIAEQHTEVKVEKKVAAKKPVTPTKASKEDKPAVKKVAAKKPAVKKVTKSTK